MKKKVKNNNNSTEEEKAVKTISSSLTAVTEGIEKPKTKRPYRIVSEYVNTINMMKMHMSEEFIDQLCIDMQEWARNTESLVLDDFWEEKKIHVMSAYRWRKKFPKFKEAWINAAQIIGNRRENLMLRFKINAAPVMHMMPKYSMAWKDREEELQALKVKELELKIELHKLKEREQALKEEAFKKTDGNSKFTIEMVSFPNLEKEDE